MSGVATLWAGTFLLAVKAPAQGAKPFTLEQVMSAPYASNLSAAPPRSGHGALFAWVEDTEGRHNLWIAEPGTVARQLTRNTEDDGQDIRDLAWSPDAKLIAYTYGAESGADGKPANPAHLQRPTPVQVVLQPLDGAQKPLVLGEGRAPIFAPDCRNVFFLRAGQIWIADLPSEWACPKTQNPQAPDAVAQNGPLKPPYQLVFDRGNASQMSVVYGDNSLLAFISTRREANQPSHSLLALFDLKTKTLTFPDASTGNDLSPSFVDNGTYIVWLRRPFGDTPEFALERRSPNPWSIKLLQLTPDFNETRDYPEPYVSPPVRTLYTAPPNRTGSVLPHMASGVPQLFVIHLYTVVFSSEADGWNHLYALDWKTSKTPTLLTPGRYEVEDPFLLPGSSILYYAANAPAGALNEELDSDRRHLYRLNFQTSGPYPVRVPLQMSHGAEIATSPRDGLVHIGALVSNAQLPMHPVAIDQNNVQAMLRPGWLPATYPADQIVTPRQVIFRSTGNLRIHGQLFLPRQDADSSAPLRNDKQERRNDKQERRNDKQERRNDKQEKHPAILFLHGGPRRQMLLGYPTGLYYSNAYAFNQYLTSRGFIVLSVNYRCGIGYGLDFRQCANAGPTGAAEYNDVLAAAKYLASRPDVDPKRVGIWGGSYGGYLTALALARNSDLFAAGVDFHGVHDWNLEDNAGDWKRGSNAEQDAIGAKARASSPLGNLSRWRSPILLIHGDNDPDVAYAQTPVLAEALRARNSHLPASQQVDVEDLIFPDEVHSFLLHRNWLAAYTAAAAFFERNLKPEPLK
jgi:acetyl esterase/lipase/Tol biopolymer transport system component